MREALFRPGLEAIAHTLSYDALVRTLPDARRCTLAGQGHDLSPRALRPVLVEFLA